MAPTPYLQLTCSACGAVSVCGPTEILARLRAAGMLRREKEPSWELIAELLPGAAERLACSSCGQAGLTITPLKDEFDDMPFGSADRPCVSCGRPIPPERIEVFPDARYCAQCQEQGERGNDRESPEFCPRCGAVMVPRMCSGRGISRYEMRCPDCGGR
jgi:hypothetical protein